MRRRRKTKYYWLPIHSGGEGTAGSPFTSVQTFSLDVVPQSQVTGLIPVVQNVVPGALGEDAFNIGDIIGNEYILKRIVGKVFNAITVTTTDTTSPTPLDSIPSVVTAAGFFVARLDPDTTGLVNTPVGGLTVAAEAYNPLNAALLREPWIWRRSWILAIGAEPNLYTAGTAGQLLRSTIDTTGDPATATISPVYPPNNASFPGVLDGPHVDAKTGRRVRQDEGLFFAAAAQFLPYGTLGPAGAQVSVDYHLDVRCLGALRRARNRSNF